MIVERNGYVKFTFAEPIKRICKEIFNFSDEQLYDVDKKEKVKKP